MSKVRRQRGLTATRPKHHQVYAWARKRVNVTRGNGIAPKGKPKLGQHFLRDQAAVTKIVDALGDISQSTVLEIGPGPGTLTGALAKRVRSLLTLQVHRLLAPHLSLPYALTPH